MNGVPPGTLLFNIIIDDLHEGIGYSWISQMKPNWGEQSVGYSMGLPFRGTSGSCGVGWQKLLDVLQRQMQRFVLLCKILSFVMCFLYWGSNPTWQYKLGTIWPESSFAGKDVGVPVHGKLNLNQQRALAAMKANRILSYTSKTIGSSWGKWFLPSMRHLWSYVQSSEFPNARQRLTNWRESSGGVPRIRLSQQKPEGSALKL